MPNPTLSDRLAPGLSDRLAPGSSDRLAPGRESWRPERHTSSAGVLLRRMALLLAGTACCAGVMGGAYAMLHGRPYAVPVIEADRRPLRVKPANPGGMQVSGEEQQIMDGSDASHTDVMAPGPEAPAPQLLAAEIQAGRPAPPAPPSPVAMDEPPDEPAAVAPPATPSVKAAAATAQAGKMEVQLAALTSRESATAEWVRLSKKMPDLLGSRQPEIVPISQDGKTLYRLRTGNFLDVAAAATFCTKLHDKGASCAVPRP